MDLRLWLMLAGAALVPGVVTFVLRRFGRSRWAAAVPAALSVAGGVLAVMAGATGGWEGLGYAVIAIFAGAGALGGLAGLAGGWFWRVRR